LLDSLLQERKRIKELKEGLLTEDVL